MRKTQRKKIIAKRIAHKTIHTTIKLTYFLTKRYILRTLAFLIYFSSITVFGYTIFNPKKGIIQPILAGTIMILTSIYLLNLDYKNIKKTFRHLALITLIPLLIFIFLNFKYTSQYINNTNKIIESSLEQNNNINLTITPVLEPITNPIEEKTQKAILTSYENFKKLIPKLKITAIFYTILFILFFTLSLKKNPLKKKKYNLKNHKKTL